MMLKMETHGMRMHSLGNTLLTLMVHIHNPLGLHTGMKKAQREVGRTVSTSKANQACTQEMLQ